MAEEIVYGNATSKVIFRGTRVFPGNLDQGLPRIGTGAEIERAAQVGVSKIKYGGFSGGLARVVDVQSYTQALTEYTYNEGWQTRSGLILPPVLTTQATLDAVDVSGSIALNLRAHAINTSHGAAGLRYLVALGSTVYTDTSLTNPALVELASTPFTDKATAIADVVMNNTAYVAVAYNGATEDIRGFTDVTTLAYNSGWTVLVALDAGDYVSAMRYMPTLGPGAGIVVGEVGGVNQVHYFKGTDSVPATLEPVVLSATKDLPAGAATTTHSALNPISGGQEGTGSRTTVQSTFTASGGPDSIGIWQDTENILASDNSDAKYSTLNNDGDNNAESSGGTTNYLIPFFDASAVVPNNHYLVGASVGIECAVSSSTLSEFYIAEVQFRVGGAQRGASKTTGGEITATDTTYTLGGSGDNWGAHVNPGEWDKIQVAVRFVYERDASAPASNSTTTSIDVDHITLTLTTAPLGQSLAFSLGSDTCAKSPAFPNSIVLRSPERDDTTAITVPRKLWRLDFTWDATQDRPVFDFIPMNAELPYVHSVHPWQGGWAVAGGNIAGPGHILKHIDGSGQLRNLRLPHLNGDNEIRVNSMFSQGEYLGLDCVLYSSAGAIVDRQYIFYANGKYFADTILQSKSAVTLLDGGVLDQPIPFAENELGLQQNQVYTIVPNTTNTAIVRQFIYSDLGGDPRMEHASQVKSMAFTTGTEDTALKIRGHEVDFLPEEANKSLTVISYHGRRISAAAGTYGSITAEIDLNPAVGAFSADISNEFTAAYSDYLIPVAKRAFRTFTPQFSGKHEAGTAKTPSLSSFVVSSVAQWPNLQTLAIDLSLDEDLPRPDVFTFLESLYTLQDTDDSDATKGNVQRLRLSSFDKAAVFERHQYLQGMRVAPMGQPPSAEELMDTRRDRNGEVRAEPVVLRLFFREVKGAVT